jgi:hypothetical protein
MERIALNIADPETGNNDIWIYESAGIHRLDLLPIPFESSQLVTGWNQDRLRIHQIISSGYPSKEFDAADRMRY